MHESIMHGVRIRDMDESGHILAVDLQHLLDLFGERTLQSRWCVSEVSATAPEKSEAAEELERLADGHTYVAGEHLSRIAHNLVQVIDGEFMAFEGDDSPWVVIRAVDSSFYEVFSRERVVLDRVRSAFRVLSDCNDVF